MKLRGPIRFALPGALAVLLVAPAALAQKIAIVTFDGPGANAVRNQLVSELCDRAECVAQTRVSTRGKIDWKKVKKLRVKYVLDGKVTGKGKKRSIELQVLAKAGKGKKKKTFKLDKRGELSDRTLRSAAEAIGALMGLAKEEAEPAEEPAEEKPAPGEKPPEEEKAEEEKPRKVTAPPPPPKEEEEQRAEEKPAGEKAEEEKPVELDEAPKGVKRPVVAIEVGLDISNKGYTYTNVATPNLRSYRAPFIVGPNLKAEAYPLALISDGLIAGLGAEVGYFLAVGLKSRKAGFDLSFPTSISRLDVGVKFQIRPSARSAAYVSPVVGYRAHSFSVGPASDGSVLDGLPPISYSALKFGVAGELPFGETGLLVFGRFAILPVLSASEVISTRYFPTGSVLGIDFGLGLGFKLPVLSMLQVRLGFDFARYGLSFRAAATDTYQADGAVDLYVGGTLGVRFTY